MVKVAQVMTEEGMAAATERECRFHLPSQGQCGYRARQGQDERGGCVSPRAPQRQFQARYDSRHGIVAPEMDRPVVRQEQIGDTREPCDRVAFFIGDRLIGCISTGHDERHAIQLAQNEMMKRRIGQHHAQRGVPGRDRWRHASGGKPVQHDNRSGR